MVLKGTYWNIANGHRVEVAEYDVLPGAGNTRYVRMPTAVVLAAGPFIGLLFAAFLPFIGIAMTIMLAGRKLIEGIVHVAVKSTSFGWRPIEAYLDGKNRRQKEGKTISKHDKRR